MLLLRPSLQAAFERIRKLRVIAELLAMYARCVKFECAVKCSDPWGTATAKS